MAHIPVATLLSEGVSLDVFTDRMTVFSMIENVLSPTFPALLPRLVIVTIYEPSPDGDQNARFFERVEVRDADGGSVRDSGPTLVEVSERPHRSVHVLSPVFLKSEGVYSVHVLQSSEEKGEEQEVSRRSLPVQMGKNPLFHRAPNEPIATTQKPKKTAANE